MLRGRTTESGVLAELLRAGRAGQSGALVLRGEAGVGKTALLDYALDLSGGYRVARAAGAETEMELPFASLHQLFAPLFADALARLPTPQRDALGTAAGLSSEARPDPFLVGLASLTLLAAAAEREPLLCLIDDAQWLDRSSARALAFAARRLQRESVVLLFAAREQDEADDLRGLPELLVRGLKDRDARDLLASAMAGPLDARVRDQIITEARGNPLAILELPRESSSARIAGGFGLPGGQSLSRRIERSFGQQVAELPNDTRRLLLIAAAEPLGDASLLWRAAALLGIPIESAGPADAAGLVDIGGRITFRHPLLRSAIYSTASSAERRHAHRALAAATDPVADPDRRAWHLAQATLGPNAAVAVELERSADRAAARGGFSAAAAFLERSAGLTIDPVRRSERALTAARAKHQAGAFADALALLDMAEAGPLPERGLAGSALLRGQITFASASPSAAVPLLLKAAARLEGLDADLARTTYLDAFFAALIASRLGTAPGVRDVALAVRSAASTIEPSRPTGHLLRGLATLIIDGYEVGAPRVQEALAAFGIDALAADDRILWLPLASRMAHEVWDDTQWDDLTRELVELARESGALAVLPIALPLRLANRLFAGDFAEAALIAEEMATVNGAIGSNRGPYGTLVLAAFRGDEPALTKIIDATTPGMVAQGEGLWLTATQYATAMVKNAAGLFREALEAAEQARLYPLELGLSTWALAELIEAAALSGDQQRAARAVHQLANMTGPSGTDWALGVEARARALIAEAGDAEAYYAEAIARLERTPMRFDLARARLLYGEWLRLHGRRVDARLQLRSAHEMLQSMGAVAFSDRAARSLLATGEKARRRVYETRDELTAQESQIAELARRGFSNPKIGAQLFISPRTVEYHLHKVFAKLGITARADLDEALSRSLPRLRQ